MSLRLCETEHLCAEVGRIFAETGSVTEPTGAAEAALDGAAIGRAAAILAAGGTVAFPTETVYGLGANALDPHSVAKIFVAKERPRWDPLIVHVANRAMLEAITEIPAEMAGNVEALMMAFWPGPLTLLLPRSAIVPDGVTAGRPLVGVRMPRHQVALEMIRRAGLPIAAPSANRFGYTSPTTAAHVVADLEGRIDAVLDGGPTTVGVESTVLDLSQTPPVVYRPGAVTVEAIGAVLGAVPRVFRASQADREGEAIPESLPSPGVGMRHYAPRARVVLVEAGAADRMAEAVRELSGSGASVGVMLPHGWDIEDVGVDHGVARVFAWGRWDDHDVLARRLFEGLRMLDGVGVEAIVCPVPEGEDVAAAIRDRLEKAARAE